MTTINAIRSLCGPLLAVVTLAGCYDFSSSGGGSGGGSLSQSDIEHYTFSFEPDQATGNVTKWWFDFDAPFDIVHACNINGNSYTANSWEFDLSTSSIDLYYDNSEAEYYTITDISDDLSSGRFHYENSVGTAPMDGDWQRLSSSQCQ